MRQASSAATRGTVSRQTGDAPSLGTADGITAPLRVLVPLAIGAPVRLTAPVQVTQALPLAMLILTSIPIVQQVLLPAPVIPAPISDSALLPSLAALLPSIVTPLPSTALLTCSALLGTALAIAVLVPIFGEESRYSERGWHRLGHGRPEVGARPWLA